MRITPPMAMLRIKQDRSILKQDLFGCVERPIDFLALAAAEADVVYDIELAVDLGSLHSQTTSAIVCSKCFSRHLLSQGREMHSIQLSTILN